MQDITTLGLPDKRAFLESGAPWPGDPPPEVIETHASLVFLTSDSAWKMKKPVTLAYVDLCSLAARERSCREELRLNRALAGDVYRRVAPLTAKSDGTLALDGEGEVVEWLVEMRRLPADQFLDNRLKSGPPPRLAEIKRVADRMFRFYQTAQSPPESGEIYLNRWLLQADINSRHLNEMRFHLATPFDPDLAREALDLVRDCSGEILERGRQGLFVDGHGDLRPEHVCLEDPPIIFDRLDFDANLRLADPYEEFNHLGLECEALGAPWIHTALLERLFEKGVPRPTPRLMSAYGANRCLARARLAIDHLRDTEVRTPLKWPILAGFYLDRARRFLADSHA